jgi:hypothetical protein
MTPIRATRQHLEDDSQMDTYKFNRSAVYGILSKLTDEEFLEICIVHFPDVFRTFTTGQTGTQRRRGLFDWAAKHRAIELLLQFIKTINPERYAEYEEEIANQQAAAPASGQAPPIAAVANSFTPEQIVYEQLQFMDGRQWRVDMVRSEACVCRIEQPEGKAWGTGFLIADDQVLTCRHVLNAGIGTAVLQDPASAWETIPTLSNLVVRFDYMLAEDRVTVPSGRLCRLALDSSWLVATATASGLDYAILHLAEAPGKDAIKLPASLGQEQECPRGSLSLPTSGEEADEQHRAVSAHDFYLGEPLMILQHPTAAPLKYAVGSVVRIEEFSPRCVLHTVNTKGGSSGSPCFTFGWQLIAMHQGSEGKINRAIPIEEIARDLKARRTDNNAPGGE